ncbi:LasU family protein [Companilactobacillus keshanensis]|uniref:LasU family protein n=1 Tax=Companilactobacillus keshanensis TaxID=2486003 RepID=A0ABW4BTR7_9LACO|nr:LasU family protein [Companilactobacillus keshanensis]
MKKILAIFPTLVLIVIFIMGIFMYSTNQKLAINYLVVSVAGTFIYTPVALFISGIASEGSGDFVKWKQISTKLKVYYLYLAGIWVVDIIIAMYFMTHN